MTDVSEKRRVLIADDSESSRDLLRVILRHAGFEVIEARDGQEALESAISARPDLIILDLNMPCLDGYAAARAIRRSSGLENIPMLALSAASSEIDSSRIVGAGFDHVAAKPLSPKNLRASISTLLPHL